MKAVLNKPVVSQGTVDLIGLTFEEARTIYGVLMCAGGSPSDSRRKHADAIKATLRPLFPGVTAICDVGITGDYRVFFSNQEGI